MTHAAKPAGRYVTFAMFGLCVPAFALFIALERRLERSGGYPLVDLQLFRNPAFSFGLAVAFLFYCNSAFFLTYGIYLQTGLHWTPLEAGMAIMPFAIGFVVGPVDVACGRRAYRHPRAHARLFAAGHWLFGDRLGGAAAHGAESDVLRRARLRRRRPWSRVSVGDCVWCFRGSCRRGRAGVGRGQYHAADRRGVRCSGNQRRVFRRASWAAPRRKPTRTHSSAVVSASTRC